MKLRSGIATIILGTLLANVTFAAGDDPGAWVGAWELTETVNYSTCQDVDVGDVRVSQLTVSTSKGKIVGTQIVGTTGISFAGETRASALILKTPPLQQDHVGLELEAPGPGRRVVSRIGVIKAKSVLGNNSSVSCAIIYDVKAVRR